MTMHPCRAASRSLPRLSRSSALSQRRTFTFKAGSPYAARKQQRFFRSILFVTALGSSGVVYQWYTGQNPIIRDVLAEEPPSISTPSELIEQAEIIFEESRKRPGASKEETRDQISSQHLQVRKSWENPGVYAWGDNAGKVAAPDANQSLIRNPRWLQYFDGKLLRDLKLTRDFGAAITEEGDLLQWGTAYNPDEKNPVVTLKGKNLKSIAISKDRVLALGSNGTVYSMSVSQEEQLLGPKPVESSWYFFTSRSPISYRTLKPTELSWNEKVSSITCGLEHALLMTSKGRVYAAAAGSEDYPTRGQMGIPGLTWFTRPPGPYDTPQEILALKGFRIRQVVAGDYHSVALDDHGRAFAWGDNQRGQLGIGDTSKDTPYFEAPSLLPINKLYAGTSQKPKVTSIAAGGNTTFLTIDAEKIASPNADSSEAARIGLGRINSDVWACGHGIWGQLGNGRWTHVQSLPTKIIPLSGLFEYDEKKRRAIPIRLRDISVGQNHVACTMDNVTHVAVSDADTENETNWGADVLFFGNNEFYQLGTGRRNNVTTPIYIQPLNRRAEIVEGRRPKQEEHRFHATPRATVKLGSRWVAFEQRVVCGRGVTAVYSGV